MFFYCYRSQKSDRGQISDSDSIYFPVVLLPGRQIADQNSRLLSAIHLLYCLF